MSQSNNLPLDAMRLDKWLWHARFFKSRNTASAYVARGRVRVNGARTHRAAKLVRVGDALTFGARGRVFVIEIVALAARRKPAPEAALLYADKSPINATPQANRARE